MQVFEKNVPKEMLHICLGGNNGNVRFSGERYVFHPSNFLVLPRCPQHECVALTNPRALSLFRLQSSKLSSRIVGKQKCSENHEKHLKNFAARRALEQNITQRIGAVQIQREMECFAYGGNIRSRQAGSPKDLSVAVCLAHRLALIIGVHRSVDQELVKAVVDLDGGHHPLLGALSLLGVLGVGKVVVGDVRSVLGGGNFGGGGRLALALDTGLLCGRLATLARRRAGQSRIPGNRFSGVLLDLGDALLDSAGGGTIFWRASYITVRKPSLHLLQGCGMDLHQAAATLAWSTGRSWVSRIFTRSYFRVELLVAVRHRVRDGGVSPSGRSLRSSGFWQA
jgi:hypothetical protein